MTTHAYHSTESTRLEITTHTALDRVVVSITGSTVRAAVLIPTDEARTLLTQVLADLDREEPQP